MKQNASHVKRRWGILPTLDQYIFREYIMIFFVLLLVFIILFLVGDVFNDLKDFLDEGATFRQMLSYFLLKLPGNIRFILPITVLLSCMYTMANFGKHMEVTAMRASGISLFRCGGSILIVGLIVTGVNFYFNEELVPYTEKEAEIAFYTATKELDKINTRFNMLTYRSPDKKRTWLFSHFDAKGEQKEVTMKKYRPNGSLEWDMQAKSASFNPRSGWTFKHAVFTPYSRDGLMPKQSIPYPAMTRPLDEIPESPNDIMNAVKAPEDLPSWVIYDILHKTQNMAQRCRDVYSTVFYYRLAFPWACFLAVFLGIPLATKNERSGIFMAVITSVVVIVVYYVSSQVFVVLGKQGIFHPVFAGIAPTVAFILFGWLNIVRHRV